MRREGRQHGFVKIHVKVGDPSADTPMEDSTKRKHGCVPMQAIDNSKHGGIPTTKIFARVPSKPTNHSKFTGHCTKLACVTCHDAPLSKSKRKSKGRSKFKTDCMDEINDVFVN
jgi:hypothetical protein